MRLSERELAIIHHVLWQADPEGRIYLFGSRAEDSKKGGDIDLFFETTIPVDLQQKLTLEYWLTSLCDTKVDLLVKHPGQSEEPIFAIARQGVLL